MDAIEAQGLAAAAATEAPTPTMRTLAGNFECAVSLSQVRTLKVTGCLFLEDTPEDMHRRIDVAQDLLDRQVVRLDIVSKEAQIAGHTQNLETIKESYQALVDKKNKGKKLSSQEQAALTNFEPTAKQAAMMIESLRAAIAVGKQKVNGAVHT